MNLRRDLISAYASSASRILSWLLVSAVVFRTLGAAAFATIAIVRATIGLLQYLSLGMAPVFVRALTKENTRKNLIASNQPADDSKLILNYAHEDHQGNAFHTCIFLGGMIGALLMVTCITGGRYIGKMIDVPLAFDDAVPLLAVTFGLAFAMRIIGDPYSALLQTRGYLWLDNYVSIAIEWGWALAISINFALAAHPHLVNVGGFYLAMMVLGLFVRVALVGRRCGDAARGNIFSDINWPLLTKLLIAGGVLLAAQAADYLYAPIDYLLINHYLGTYATADYAAAIQVDAAMLVLVGAIGAALLPHTAIAHTTGRMHDVWRFYVRGTVASVAILAVAAIVFWALSPGIFRLWLGNDMPATRAILPLVLIHTVIGGSSAVGRSILLGIGRTGAFAVAALAGGLLNLVLSYLFIAHLNLGMRGVIYATIIAVTLRCAIWMPGYIWYVLHKERQANLHATARGLELIE